MKGVSEQGEGAPDDGQAIHYMAVPPGTPVYAADGTEIGAVKQMLDNSRENIFDGVVFRTPDGRLRFVDAPEVRRTAERGVTLSLSVEEAERLGPPHQHGVLGAAGALGRLFGRRGRG